MKARNLLNLLLLLIVIVLISFTIQTINIKQTTGKSLLDIKREDIKQITIPRPQGDIVLNKNNSEWRMSTPYTARAHSFRVNMLLDLIDIAIANSYDINTEKLKSFGLDTPRASILFNNQAIHFGKQNPVTKQRYIQTEKFISLINDQIYPLISSQPSSFVDLKILDSGHLISGLHLPDFSLLQQDDGHWSLSGKQQASADQIQVLLEHWRHAQAFAVHAYLPRKQLGSLVIELDSGKTVELEISDTSPWLILGQKQLGIEYHLDSEMYNRLFRLDQPSAKSE
ncbi:MAG: DUF4340 domain-containing protein [Gammaproteobacteria bacterium]